MILHLLDLRDEVVDDLSLLLGSLSIDSIESLGELLSGGTLSRLVGGVVGDGEGSLNGLAGLLEVRNCGGVLVRELQSIGDLIDGGGVGLEDVDGGAGGAEVNQRGRPGRKSEDTAQRDSRGLSGSPRGRLLVLHLMQEENNKVRVGQVAERKKIVLEQNLTPK